MQIDRPKSVLSIDDRPLLSKGIATLNRSEPDTTPIAVAATAWEGIEKLREIRPDSTLMDMCLPDSNGIDSLIAIRAEFPDALGVFLTVFGCNEQLTERELEVLRHVGVGNRNLDTANQLSIAEETGKTLVAFSEVNISQLQYKGGQ